MRASSHLLRTAGEARTRLRVVFRGYASSQTRIDATKSIERESGCRLKEILVRPELTTPSIPFINRTFKDRSCAQGISTLSGEDFRRNIVNRNPSNKFKEHIKNYRINAFLPRIFSCNYTSSSKGTPKEETRKDMSISDDPFDPLTSNIPEKPVTFVEGASYSVIIFAGLGVAALAIYAVFKELIFQPKEYKIFGKALERVQSDNQVTVRIGSPVTGYGNQSRNRAARQRIHNRVWTDEDGVEHVEVIFYIRGPHGAGKVYTEMFKDQADKSWKYMFLIVEITDPSPVQLMLESYIPA